MDSPETGDNWVGRTLQRVADSRRVRRPAPLASAVQVILWWEIRRPMYNLVVGGSGLAVCGASILCALITEHLTGESGDHGLPDSPLFGVMLILLYGTVSHIEGENSACQCPLKGLQDGSVRRCFPATGMIHPDRKAR